MRIILSTVVVIALVGLFVLVVPSGSDAEGDAPVELADYGSVGDFEFIDQTGEAFSSEALKGKIWLANFVFTSCNAECPVLTQRMVQVREKLGSRSDLAFVSFSVDPQTDTPRRLSEYAKTYGEDQRWKLLTGEPNKLDTLIKSRILIPITFDFHTRRDIASASFIHSNQLVVIDERGEIRYATDGLEPGAVERLTEAMARLLEAATPPV